MATLGGVVPIRNAFILDFCLYECVQSLLNVCDKVGVSISPGEDQTEEYMREWASREPKLVLNIYPWPEPKGNADWYTDWLQYARIHTPTDFIFQLDADEVLSEQSYPELRKFVEANRRRSGIVTRYNFWRDHKHLIPEGQCLGKRVIRVGPQNVWLPSDGPHPNGAEWANMSVGTGIEIFHVGFIRKREEFFKKERLLQNYYFASYDPRLEKAQSFEGNWMDDPGVSAYSHNPDDYNGHYPEILKPWLRERGMEV